MQKYINISIGRYEFSPRANQKNVLFISTNEREACLFCRNRILNWASQLQFSTEKKSENSFVFGYYTKAQGAREV